MNNKKKCLFIHTVPIDEAYGGSKRTLQNYEGLNRNYICDDYHIVYKPNKIKSLIYAFVFGLRSINLSDERKIIKKIKSNNYDVVFLNKSLYGHLVKKIKNEYSNIKVIVHYHNYEKKFYEDLSKGKSFIYKLLVAVISANEKLSTLYSDARVFISKEDMINVCVEYGVSDKNSKVIPVALRDYFNISANKASFKYVLFIGSKFYANIEATRYLIERISPYVNKKIVIVGKGMKKIFVGNYKNVKIYDYVESLNDLLSNALGFISPVFLGSGSKIKVAEALMFGKYIIGSKNSFNGYDVSKLDASICESDSDFIREINALDFNKTFYPKNREAFIAYHDLDNSSLYYCFDHII